MIRRGAGVVAAVALIAACATKDPTNPGTVIGTFNVTGTLTTDSCGGAPSPWTFQVQLNHDDLTLYWIQGGWPIAGDVDTTGSASITATTTVEARAATSTLAECDLERDDALKVLLSDASSKAVTDPGTTTSFLGTLSYTFAPTSGSSCDDQLSSAGDGGYNSLPCTVAYTITGALGTTAAETTTN